MRITRKLSMLLLAIWLILGALISLIGLHGRGLEVVMGILALVAGILMLLER